MVGPQPELDRRLDRLVQRLREAGGGNLLGIALYGGLVKGRYTPGVSDINILVVLAEAGLAALLPLAPVLTEALRESVVVPFVATPVDLRESAVLFPVKVLDIQRSHRVLWGDVHLQDIRVEPAALRLRALQELKNTELRLRLQVVERGADPDAMWRALTNSLPKLAVTLETLLRTRGVDVPSDRPGILRSAALELGIEGIEPGRMERIAKLRRVDPRPDEQEVRERMADLLGLLDHIGRIVDGGTP
jgi:predicted nucleotidyltransferase